MTVSGTEIVIETVTVTEKGKTEIETETVDEIGHGKTVVAVVVVGAITCLLAVEMGKFNHWMEIINQALALGRWVQVLALGVRCGALLEDPWDQWALWVQWEAQWGQ